MRGRVCPMYWVLVVLAMLFTCNHAWATTPKEIPEKALFAEWPAAIVNTPEKMQEKLLMYGKEAVRAEPVIIRVLFALTDDVATKFNNDSGLIQAHFQGILDYANQVFVNSGVSHIKFEMAHWEVFDYNEIDVDKALDDINDIYDGEMDEVHKLRDLYQADMVALAVTMKGGMASQFTPHWPYFRAHCFHVFIYSSAEAFTHEVGHNLGLNHDDQAGYFPWSKGYRVCGVFTTMMAGGCGGYSIDYFSSPDIYYKDQDFTGETYLIGVEGEHDNAGTLPITAPMIGELTNPAGKIPNYDFNRDGKSDILWQKTTDGQVGIWIMGISTQGQELISGTLSTYYYTSLPKVKPNIGWEIVGAGDFNRDGYNDILWRNSKTGMIMVWFLNGITYAGSVAIAQVDMRWKVKCVGSFNQDAHVDIVWQRDDGNIVVWFMDGVKIHRSVRAGKVDPSWEIKACYDFNDDGHDDLVFRNSNGNNGIWFMNRERFVSWVAIQGAQFPWDIKGAGDYMTTGGKFLLWRNQGTGKMVLWKITASPTRMEDTYYFTGSVPVSWDIK